MALGEQEVPEAGHPGQQRGRLLYEEGALLSGLLHDDSSAAQPRVGSQVGQGPFSLAPRASWPSRQNPLLSPVQHQAMDLTSFTCDRRF